ncbi:hypothetical protein ASG48_14615 [Aurantimonas sp. Leaf443]|nr:hypothetical protein ASG48_14615 [Aurantimonas sp. Leaf443]
MPDAASVGAAPNRALERFDPIALPTSLSPGASPKLDLPDLKPFGPQPKPHPEPARASESLSLSARLTQDGPEIPNGLVWRLFAAAPDASGKLPLIATSAEANPNFAVPRGSYLLHVLFGRAGMTKRIEFAGLRTRETVVMDAGGLKLSAVAPNDAALAQEKVFFDVYTDADQENDRQLVASHVPANRVVRLNAGNYHVVSSYGAINAVVRADIRVEAGKLTEATLQHHAAQLTLKLVREKGGEAIADTAWSITTASGDPVRESVGAFSSLVLAEGDYLVLARNRGKLYQRSFSVEAGRDEDVEVLTSDLAAPENGEGSGD